MAVFSKLSVKSAKTVGRLETLVARTKAKVSPRLPRSGAVLSGVKLAAMAAGKLGSSVPHMQGIVDAANEVVAYAEAMKTNRKECKKIAELTEELVKGLLAETEGVEEEEEHLSERSRLSLAELEWRLETIGRAMKEMREATFFRRLVSKDEHAAKLVEHRRALQDAMTKFQIMQSIQVHLEIARLGKKQDMLLEALAVGAGGRSVPRDRVEWLSVAVIQGLRSKNPIFFFKGSRQNGEYD